MSSRSGEKLNRSLCLSRRSATIKQHISTLFVHSLIVMASKYVLVLHCDHTFIVNVEPSFLTTAASVRVEHVDGVAPAACGLAVVVKHSIQLVVHRLCRFPGNGCQDFWTNQAMKNSQHWLAWGKRRRKSYRVEFRALARTEQLC